jgi:hypothetical protein
VGDIALMERCHDGIVRELHALGGVGVVTDSAWYRFASFEEQIRLSERFQKVARAQGAGKVLTVSTSMGCDSALFSSDARERVQGAGGGGVDPQGARVEGYSKSMAYSVRTRTLLDAAAEVAQARAVLLDASLPDGQRAAALWVPLSLQNSSPDGRFPGLSIADFGADVAKVVFDIGRREQDAHLRGMA